MVVKRKIANGQQICACGVLGCPVGTANFGGNVLQLGFAGCAFPEGFGGEFEFAFTADAGIA